MARAVVRLEEVLGLVPRCQGKGSQACRFVEILYALRGEAGLCSDPLDEEEALPESCADRLVVIDRGIDRVTPLITQLTYAGLVDEILGGTVAASDRVSEEPIKVRVRVRAFEEPIKARTIYDAPAPKPNPKPYANRDGQDLVSQQPVRIHFDTSDYLWMEMKDLSFSAAEMHLKVVAQPDLP